MKIKILLVLAVCFTLGLAPFRPEPHIWGKLKWIAGGAKGMEFIDYWDTFMHGAPWILLIYLLVQYILMFRKK